MFYGSGAGKLPTASAVVADIVEIAKHLDENIPVEWRKEKLSLLITDSSKINILSVQQQTKLQSRKFLEAFPMYGQRDVTGENAFVTAEMDGFAYDKAEAELGEVLQCIRVK